MILCCNPLLNAFQALLPEPIQILNAFAACCTVHSAILRRPIQQQELTTWYCNKLVVGNTMSMYGILSAFPAHRRTYI